MNINLIITLSSSLIISIIGIFVLLKDSKSKINFYFFILTQFFSLVTIANYLSTIQYTQSNTLFFMRLTILFAFFVFFSLFLFIRYLCGIPINFNRLRNKILFFLAVIVVPIIIISPLAFKSVVLHPTITPSVGPGIAVFLISNILLLFFSFKTLFHKYRNSYGYERLQIGYLLYGLISLFIIIFVFNIILPIFFNDPRFLYLGNFYPIALFILISYSIVSNRLFNLKIAVRSILIYSMSFILLAILEWILNIILDFNLTFIFFLIEIIFSLLIILIFPKIYEFTTIILDKYLFKRIQNINIEIEKLLQSINSNIDASKFFDFLKSSIKNIFGVSSIAFVLIDDGNIDQIFSDNMDSNTIQKAFSVFKDIKDIVVISEMKNTAMSDLINAKIEVVIPINSNESKLLAFIILGRKISKDSFFTNDIKILEQLRVQISIFIANMNLYHQVLNFNTELQTRVKEATRKLASQNKELENANEQLKSLDKLKDDLLSIASHELRTPAGIVKGNVYLAKSILEKIKDKVGEKNSKSEEFKRLTRYISRSVESIDNEIRIINTLLEASRLGREDMTMIPENIDLEGMIESQRDALLKDAEAKGIKIVYKKEKIDKVFGDRAKVEEILGNLITNAIKYSEKGTIEISTEKEEGFVIVHVKDEGIGISEEDMGGLFQKFHRLNNYTGDPNDPQHLLVRPGGTGLGLYVTKGLVEKMGGQIWVDSIPGKGSTFSFKLPVSKVLEVNEGEFKSKDMFAAMGLQK